MKLVILGFLLAMVNLTNAQSSTLSGKVLVAHTTKSISEINVIVDDGSHYAITNGTGRFEIKGMEKGSHDIVVSGIGFKTLYQNVVINSDLEEVVFYLIEDIIDLPLVEVNAQSGTGGMMGSLQRPGSSHYIAMKDLKTINSQNPHDILQNIPGVQIQEEDGFGLRPNIGLRASGSERSSKITVMEDGVLAAPAPYAASSAYYFPTMARMSAVEIMKGSSQIVYGPYTVGGVINLISTPIPTEFKGKVRLGAGSFGARNVNASLGNKHGNFSYLLETFQFNAEGFKKIDFSDNETGFDKKDYLGKIKWTSSPGSGVYQSVEVKLAESKEHSDETYLGLNYTDFLTDPYRRYAGSQMDEMNTRHRQYNIKYIISPIKDLYLQATVYRNQFSRNWYKLDKLSNDVGAKVGISTLLNESDDYASEYGLLTGRSSIGSESLEVKANNRSYLSQGIQTKGNYTIKNHAFEVGVRWHYDEMDRYQWVDDYVMNNGNMQLSMAGIHGTESNRIESAYALASHFQHTLKLDKLKITTGLRNESMTISRIDYGKSDPDRVGDALSERDNEVSVWIPGVSIQYDVTNQHQVFGGVHRGFAPPSSSAETESELSVNYEIGYRVQQSELYGSIVGFYNDYTNLLGDDLASSGGTGNGDQYNGGRAMSYGLELSLNYTKTISNKLWVPIQMQYTYNNAKFSTSFESDFEPWMTVEKGDNLPYLANHTWSLMTGLRHAKVGWNISLNYTSDMRTVAGQGDLVQDQTINGRLLISSNINYNVNKDTDLTIGVHNLLDKRYAVASRPAGWRPGAPRNFNVGIEARF